jgi:hypothetical protein
VGKGGANILPVYAHIQILRIITAKRESARRHPLLIIHQETPDALPSRTPSSNNRGSFTMKQSTTRMAHSAVFSLGMLVFSATAWANDPDTDLDSLSDLVEAELGTDPLIVDSDGDDLDDGAEVGLGTDPLNPDSDWDRFNDGAEVAAGTNPLELDTDGDAATDGEELQAGTDPLDEDSDADGLLDGAELEGITDALGRDTDDDGATDHEEFVAGTDPVTPDSDGDGLDDGLELASSTDASLADTDDDGLWDGTETALAEFDPLAGDSDGDGVDDVSEVVTMSNLMASQQAGSPQFSFQRLAGVNYRVFASENLSLWEMVADYPASSTTVSYEFSPPPPIPPKMFLKIVPR